MNPADPPVWVRRDGAGWLLDLHVQPGARVMAVAGVHDGRLKLKIAAPRVDNKANECLLIWMAERLGVPKSSLRLVRGAASRQKTVAVCAGGTPWLDIENNSRT